MFLADPKDANKIADALQRANNGQLTLVSPDTIAGSNYSERLRGISSTG